jgi:hypothetical protein
LCTTAAVSDRCSKAYEWGPIEGYPTTDVQRLRANSDSSKELRQGTVKPRTPVKQRGICCPCGRMEILALGLCASCYSMKRQDEENYGGLREVVLDRDERRCRACPNIERRKLCVHHRKPGVSKLELMITLCTRCHAIVERTQMVLGEMTPLLLVLWREKHPDGQEQLYLPLDAELPCVAEQLRIPVKILH